MGTMSQFWAQWEMLAKLYMEEGFHGTAPSGNSLAVRGVVVMPTLWPSRNVVEKSTHGPKEPGRQVTLQVCVKIQKLKWAKTMCIYTNKSQKWNLIKNFFPIMSCSSVIYAAVTSTQSSVLHSVCGDNVICEVKVVKCLDSINLVVGKWMVTIFFS